jgi:hypothetical protein
MRIYEHRMISGSDYQVWYVSEGCTKQVNKDKPDYLQWVTENTPEVIPYVAPEPIPVETLRQDKRRLVDSKTAELISNGYAFTFDGKGYTFDTSPDSLSKLSVAYNVAKRFLSADLPYSQAMVMKDYQVVTMDRDSIISNYDAMIAFGLQLYGQHALIIQQLNVMSYEDLSNWVDPRTAP